MGSYKILEGEGKPITTDRLYFQDVLSESKQVVCTLLDITSFSVCLLVCSL